MSDPHALGTEAVQRCLDEQGRRSQVMAEYQTPRLVMPQSRQLELTVRQSTGLFTA